MSQSTPSTTTFASRGRLAGLIREEAPAGTAQNRGARSSNRGSDLGALDEAIYYRARLLLGDSLPRPQR